MSKDLSNLFSFSEDLKNSKFAKILLEAIAKSDQAGFDYLEFKQAVQSLSQMDMDKTTQFKSAFAMAKTMGVSPNDLVSSARHYMNVLNEERTKFSSAVEKQMQKQVVIKQHQLQEITTNVENKLQEIEKLKAEVTQMKQKAVTISDELKNASNKITETKESFNSTLQVILDEIEIDQNLIKQSL